MAADNTDMWKSSFDIKFALSALYLWLLFGFLSSMVNCDLQRLIQTNWLFRHVIGIVSFILLFTIIDSSNQIPIQYLLLKTFLVYSVFILMIKSKWYFSLPVLSLLVIDQIIKAQIDYLTKADAKSNTNTIDILSRVRFALTILIILLIIIGFVMYAIRQKMEFGDEFNFATLLFSSKCGSN